MSACDGNMCLGNKFTLVDVQVSATNTTGLDLDLMRVWSVRFPVNGWTAPIPGHRSRGSQAQGPRRSCASWALSTAEHAWS